MDTFFIVPLNNRFSLTILILLEPTASYSKNALSAVLSLFTILSSADCTVSISLLSISCCLLLVVLENVRDLVSGWNLNAVIAWISSNKWIPFLLNAIQLKCYRTWPEWSKPMWERTVMSSSTVLNKHPCSALKPHETNLRHLYEIICLLFQTPIRSTHQILFPS